MSVKATAADLSPFLMSCLQNFAEARTVPGLFTLSSGTKDAKLPTMSSVFRDRSRQTGAQIRAHRESDFEAVDESHRMTLVGDMVVGQDDRGRERSRVDQIRLVRAEWRRSEHALDHRTEQLHRHLRERSRGRVAVQPQVESKYFGSISVWLPISTTYRHASSAVAHVVSGLRRGRVWPGSSPRRPTPRGTTQVLVAARTLPEAAQLDAHVAVRHRPHARRCHRRYVPRSGELPTEGLAWWCGRARCRRTGRPTATRDLLHLGRDGAATHALMSTVLSSDTVGGLRSMSCWPGDSRALGVLLGFQREIRAFVSSSDRCSLSRVSWWFYQSATSAGGDGDGDGNASWPSDGQLSALAHRVHSQLARGGGRSDVRRKKTKARLAVGHVRVLLRELLLVACGLRASCLVDCCALTKELAGLLLSSLAAESEYRWCSAVHRVRAVLLDGNVFFVNVDAFVREKMAGPQPLYVNVSASLTQPQLLSNDSNEASRLQAFAEWTTAACRELLRSTTGQVLEWRRSPSLNATALAGILLCYPCVYDVLEDENSSDTDDGWGEHENCLAMCPLVVLQTACLFMPLQQLEIVLHEFSVPRHLLCRFNEELLEQVDAMSFPLVKLLQARCRLKLQHAIEQSSLLPASVQPQVRGHTCTLPRVAL